MPDFDVSPEADSLSGRELAPLSYSQEMFWLYGQLDEGGTYFPSVVDCWIEGPLDVHLLERALDDILGDHEVFRSRVEIHDGVPMQRVMPPEPISIEVVDLSQEPDPEAAARAAAQEYVLVPVDLATGTVGQVKLFRASEELAIIVVPSHHAASDGSTIVMLRADLVAAYEARAQGRAPGLPPPTVQHADYARRERERFEGRDDDPSFRYWVDRLAGAPTVVDLPGDRPRAPRWQGPIGRFESFVAPELDAAIKALSRELGATRFHVYLAVFGVLVSRLTGLDDFIVGVPTSGRNDEELARAAGPFLNMLAVRMDLSGDPTFAELVARVRDRVVEDRRHADLPMTRLVQALGVERDLSRTPLVQLEFNSVNQFKAFDETAGGVRFLSRGDLRSSITRHDISFLLVAGLLGLRFYIDYNSQLYDGERVDEMGAQYLALADSLVAAPDLPVGSHSLVTDRAAGVLPDLALPATGDLPVDGTTDLGRLVERAAAVAGVPPDELRPAQLLVVRRGGRLAGVAELGEIAVRSPLLTKAPFGWDQLARGRVISNPLTGEQEDRLYLTGVLGRFDARGQVEVDHMALPDALSVPADQGDLPEGWNETAAAYPRDRCMHDLVAEVAARHPDALALVSDRATLTYGALWRALTALAERLRDAGARPGGIVPFHVADPLDGVVALLGVLASGAAYVPLDVSQPEERLDAIIAECRPVAVVADEAGRSRLGRLGDLGVPIVVLDAPGAEGTADGAPPSSGAPATPDDLAYVLFTSGSTGTPKGVMVTHRNLVSSTWARVLHYPEPAERSLLMHSLAFDASVGILFWTLCTGGSIRLLDDDLRRDATRLPALIAREQITDIDIIPSFWGYLLDEADEGQLASVRRVFVGAEACSPSLVDRHALELPGCAMFNEYGPTETTVWSTVWQCTPEAMRTPAGERTSVPIGRPVPNTRAYVLDAERRPVPVGVPAELYLGGPGVARGYLGRDDLTAERFLVDPFADGSSDGGRMYRTGDLVRLLPDGVLEFLGRADEQVKIRGYRIELGEIESALLTHPGVAACAVQPWEEGGAATKLAAYVVPATDGPAGQGVEVSPAELREHCAALVPDYMVPAAFTRLAALPRNRNGKLDRRALPKPDGSDVATRPYVAPRDETETALTEVWALVLGVDRVGIDDDFFALGGHSLLATRMLARVRQGLGIEIPMRLLFEATTVRALAEHVRASVRDVVVPMERVEVRDRFPVSFAQQRMWFLVRLDPTSPAYNIPYVVRLEGQVDADLLEQALGEVVRRHESMRTTFVEEDGTPWQVVHHEMPVSLLRTSLKGLPEDERDTVLADFRRQDSASPFDLATGPLLRMRLLSLGERESALILVVHHIVSDGWSLGLLVQELSTIYTALAEGRPHSLPDLEIQYGDFAWWQHHALEGPVLARETDYWVEHLSGAPPAIDLPTDRPRPALQSYRGGRVDFEVRTDVHDRLMHLARPMGATWFMVLLAAYTLVLRRMVHDDDVVIGSPIAGRTHAATEGLLGFFINMLPMRVDLSGDPTFRELLARARASALGAYDHQQVPFERLVEELNPVRDASRTPVFQVTLNLLNVPSGAGTSFGPGVVARPAGLAEAASKFDATMYAWERPLGHGAGGLFVYNADLFDADRMDELVRQFEQVLDRAGRNPDVPMSELSLVTPAAAAEVLPDPLATIAMDDSARGQGEPFERLIASAARHHPDSVAVEDESASWTYAVLDATASRVASSLVAAGVGKGDVVAVAATRSAALAAVLAGVARAGAAFCILDPAYPTARLLACCEVARPVALLEITGSLDAARRGALVDAIAGLHGSEAPLHLELPALPAGLPAAEPPAEVTAPGADLDDLAYVAFTSGTTGTPSGVLAAHGPLAHFVEWYVQTFDVGPDDRVSVLAGLSHDPLLRDLFVAPRVGATVVVPSQRVIDTPGGLGAWMLEQRVTIAHVTPAMAQVLVETAHEGLSLPDLRLVCFGGDMLTEALVAAVRQLAPGARCVNFYGATETPQAVAWHDVPGRAEDAASAPAIARVPIGRGVDGVQLLVMNGAGRLAGIGELGEVWVRTPHLSLGYAGDVGSTSERFTSVPGDASRVPVFRTGDLGRFRPDGLVELAGRADRQVKIRGFRIEPAEVEAALRSHPEVVEAAVAAVEDRRGAPSLVAYVVLRRSDGSAADAGADPGAPAIARTLRDHLSGLLPAASIPGRFVPVEAIPLTRNNKVDYAALATIAAATEEPRRRVAPRDDVEQKLVEIWAEVLGVEGLGVTDDFFDLGGHSLLALRLFNRIAKVFSVELPLADLFRYPTVEGLATRLRSDDVGAAGWGPVVPINARGSLPTFFCIHGIGGNVLRFRDLARHLGDDQPFHALQAQGLDGRRYPFSSIEEMAASYVQALREVQPHGPYYLGGYSLGGVVAFEMARCLLSAGEQVGCVALLDSYGPEWDQLERDFEDSAPAMRSSRARRLRRRGKELAKKVVAQAALVRGRVPMRLRPWYLHRQGIRLRKRYRPTPVDVLLLHFGSAEAPFGGDWTPYGLRGLESFVVPGDHDDMFYEPHVEVLASQLSHALARARASMAGQQGTGGQFA